MLKLICGEAGTGKSELVRKRIAEAVKNGKKVVLFVPDQFSFEAEKLLYKDTPQKLGDECRVAMFSREAQRILKLSGETKLYADDIAKRVVIKLALEETAANGELKYYTTQAKQKGFSTFALNIISDIRNAGLSPSMLKNKLSKETSFSDKLTDKMNDISVIYGLYDDILTRNFSDKLDDVRRAAEKIRTTDIFDGYEIFFDEFDSFSGTQQDFIRALLEKAENVTLAMTCNNANKKDRRFIDIQKTISRISGKKDPEVCELTQRFRKPTELKIVEARDKWQECDWICSEIRALADNDVRYRDIAIITPDVDSVRVLDSTLSRYDIPAFTDIPEPLISKWFVRFPIYTLLALSFDTNDILRYVKSGFVRNASGFVINSVLGSNSDADKLERVSRMYDLRKKDWLNPFPANLDITGKLEELRKCVIEPLTELAAAMGISKPTDKADGAAMTEALCNFICEKMRITDTIYSKCIKGKDENGKNIYDGVMLDSLSEIWDDMITVFESAHKALKGHMLTLSEYTEILTDIFTTTTIAKPPHTLDAVTVGDTTRSRFNDKKYVFICGSNRGVMPPPAPASDVFTPTETELLAKADIPIASDCVSRSSQELYTIYRCSSIPSVRLYVTYPVTNVLGEHIEPADAIERIKQDFDKTAVEALNASDRGASFYCRTQASAERYLAEIFRDKTKAAEKKALYKRVSENVTKMLEFSSGVTPNVDRHRVPKVMTSQLLTMPTWSPSAIDTMIQCKFSFFCKYELGLREYRDRSVDAALVGNVIHFCLERLLTDYLGQKDQLIKLTDDDIKQHVAVSISKYETDNYFGGFGGAKRFSYLLGKLSKYAVLAARRTRDELALSSFEPEALEQKLTFPFAGVTIDGKCDRIDTCVVDGKKYARVIDYKRRKDDVSIADIFKGNNIQALLYLYGKCGTADIMPSSASYNPVGLIEYEAVDGDEKANGLQNYMTKHSPRGLMINGAPDSNDINGINTQLNALYGSTRTNYIKLTGVSDDVYSVIKSYCDSYISTGINEVNVGMVSARPNTGSKCEYCAFSLFCRKK